MLSAHTVAVAFLLLATGCHGVSPTEQKLIGTWSYSGMDFTTRVEFRADHTMATLMGDQKGRVWTPITSGKWHIEASDLILEEQALPNLLPLPGDTPRPKERGRRSIREITPDKIIWADSSGFQPYTRVK